MALLSQNRATFAVASAVALLLPLAAAATDVPVFNLAFENGVITPQTLEIPADKTVVLRVENKGSSAAEFESKPLHIEKIIAPGASAEITLHGVVAGSYKFVDEFTEQLETANGVILVK